MGWTLSWGPRVLRVAMVLAAADCGSSPLKHCGDGTPSSRGSSSGGAPASVR
jgi:hypothetical protein